MPIAVMGEGLGLRPAGLTETVLSATLPHLDPSRYGLADYDLYGGPVDFSVAKAHGLQRPIIRVGQGFYGIDPQFVASSANSKGLFSRDFYWMLDTHQSANGQATACANALVANGRLDTDSILFADFELAPANASFLYGFLTTLHNLLGSLRLGIYTGYSYWATYGSTDPSWAKYPLWIAWPVTPYQEPPPLKPWTSYYYHQWTFNGDGYYYGLGSVGDGLDLDYKNPALVGATAVVLQRPLAQYEICVTPSTVDVLPLVDVVTQAEENGWEVGMNCGAGFSYTDVAHAQINGTSAFEGTQYSEDASFGSIYIGADGSISDVRPASLYTAIPYARRAITAGSINPALDTVALAAWCLVGFDSDSIFLIVTKGVEGVSGLTQMQAAQYAQSLGITDCYLMDSGHSANIEENNILLFSENGEAIPQCIGLRPKGVVTVATKVTVNVGAIANLKDIATGAILHVAQPGEYLYGTKNAAGTDVIGFSHYYTKAGVLTQLNPSTTQGCKVSIGGTNVTVVNNVVEPTPNPGGTPTKVHQIDVMSDGSLVIDGKPYVG